MKSILSQDEFYIQLGARLYQIRQELDISTSAIASTMGNTSRTVYSWEKSESKIPIKNFVILCDLYKIPYDKALDTYFEIDSKISEQPTIGARIKKARVLRSVSPQELAPAIGLSSHKLLALERGLNLPKVYHVYAIANSLEVSPCDLIQRDILN